jgi:hypothetical protein
MAELNRYLAEIGRRGGIRSRRVLAPETARRMVAIREASRAARRAASRDSVSMQRLPADTSASAQAFQDALVRFMSPAEKLERVASLSQMVNSLAAAGITLRHPEAGSFWIRMRQAEQRLGRELTRKVYGWSSD